MKLGYAWSATIHPVPRSLLEGLTHSAVRVAPIMMYF